jgi:hypothetical protein
MRAHDSDFYKTEERENNQNPHQEGGETRRLNADTTHDEGRE